MYGPWANGHTPLSLGRGASKALYHRGAGRIAGVRAWHSAWHIEGGRASLKDPEVPPCTKDRWAASGWRAEQGRCAENEEAGQEQGRERMRGLAGGRARAQQVRVGWAGPRSGQGLQVRGHAPAGE